MIEIDDLSVRFGAVCAISGLTMSFTEPITGVIGPNGAGKTTLLNAIAGAVRSTGMISLDGSDLSSTTAFERARRGVRRSFQSALLIEELSVLDNVRLALDADMAGSAGSTAATDALDILGIADLAGVTAGRLVNLERRLVGLARAIVTKPSLLLLDEPGAGLVSHEKQRLAQCVTMAATDFAKSTILIEHDMEFVSDTCPTVVALNFGSLLAQGPTDEVLRDPGVRSAYLGEEF